MNIGFYIDEMNFRGVANSSYDYSLYNQTLLKNKSFIFYNKKNQSNKKEVILKFKRKFKVIGINDFKEIDSLNKQYNLNYIYVQKSGDRNQWRSNKIKTLIHCVYPQKLKEIHGHKYAYISNWLSKKFSNNKIPFVPLIVRTHSSKKNLKKNLKIKKKQSVIGCYGGESSFDLKFVHKSIIETVKRRKDIIFLFLNINKFYKHPRIIFLKGTTNEILKKNFINTCDAMIYGRSLGESFGLACGEFSMEGKKIISYRFNRHRSHVYNLPKNGIQEYSSFKELLNILTNFNRKKINYSNKNNKYLQYSPERVMKIFNKVFLKDDLNAKVSIVDHCINFANLTKMHYQYIKHKVYNHYYRFFESKFIFYKD